MIGGPTFDIERSYKNLLVQLCHQPADAVESQKLEIKGWCSDERQLAEKVSEAAACLASTDGGTVLIGIEEGAGIEKFSACLHRNVTPEWIVARVHDLTIPPVECFAHDLSELLSEILEGEGCNVFALDVPRSKYVSGHMTVKGISKIRVGKECRPHYTTEDDRSRVVVPDVTTYDLSITSIRGAIDQHHKHFQTPKQQSREPFEYLIESRLLEPWLLDEETQPRFRVPLATLILFGKENILNKALPFFETVVITPVGTKFLRKNVTESIREICGGPASLAVSLYPTVPLEAIRELVVNAYMHRCYRTNAPIVLTFNESEIVVESPIDGRIW